MWRAAIRFPVRQFHPVRFSHRYFTPKRPRFANRQPTADSGDVAVRWSGRARRNCVRSVDDYIWLMPGQVIKDWCSVSARSTASRTRSPPSPSCSIPCISTASIVTLDAMGCQKDIAARIRAKGADYLLAQKANHGRAFKAARGHFERTCFSRGSADVSS
jgi:hypothetical protein